MWPVRVSSCAARAKPGGKSPKRAAHKVSVAGSTLIRKLGRTACAPLQRGHPQSDRVDLPRHRLVDLEPRLPVNGVIV
jgi:hypothetical protein